MICAVNALLTDQSGFASCSASSIPLISATRLSLKEVPKLTTRSSFSPISSPFADHLWMHHRYLFEIIRISFFAFNQFFLSICQSIPCFFCFFTLLVCVLISFLNINCIDQSCYFICCCLIIFCFRSCCCFQKLPRLLPLR